MSGRRIFTVLALAAAILSLAALPSDAYACAMCFSGSEESRKAFFVTAAFLTLLPLGMVAGTTAWLRGRARRADAEPDGANDEAGDEPPEL